MGKRICIYGIDLAALASKMPPELERTGLLTEYLGPNPAISADALIQKIQHVPSALSVDQLQTLVLCSEDWWEIARPDARANPARRGIDELLEITATNPSMAFLELAWDFFETVDQQAESDQGDGARLMNRPTAKRLFSYLTQVTGYFETQARGSSPPELQAVISQSEVAYPDLEPFYHKSLAEREELGESYSDKWAGDHFAFAEMFFEQFARTFHGVDQYDKVLVIDC